MSIFWLRNLVKAIALTVREGSATTLPPRSTAPIIGSLSVPLPRLEGVSESRLLPLRGLPPTYDFVRFYNTGKQVAVVYHRLDECALP